MFRNICYLKLKRHLKTVMERAEDSNGKSTRSITHSALSTQQTTNFSVYEELQHSKSIITYTLRKCSNKTSFKNPKAKFLLYRCT
jgi:hypothetical protein